MDLKILLLVESIETWTKQLGDFKASLILHQEELAFLKENEFQELKRQFPETYHNILEEEYRFSQRHKRLFKRYAEV